jgi:hypothetical protein
VSTNLTVAGFLIQAAQALLIEGRRFQPYVPKRDANDIRPIPKAHPRWTDREYFGWLYPNESEVA